MKGLLKIVLALLASSCSALVSESDAFCALMKFKPECNGTACSGDKDPVGEMGKGVRRAYEAFRRAGVRDVELKLYKGLRHEILNEDCRAVVYNDLWSWIEKHL